MATTDFSNGTVIETAWLNDVDEAVYTDLPAVETKLTNVTTISAAAATLLDDTTSADMRGTLGAAQYPTNSDITSLAAITTINSGPLAGMRNRIINGDFRINQRGNSGAAATLAYLSDRWYTTSTGTAPTYVASTTASIPGYLETGALTLNGHASNTLVRAWQKIEADNCRDMAGQTVTLSYWCYQDTGAAVTCTSSLYYPTVRDDFTTNTLISASAGTSVPNAAWTRVTSTFTVSNAAITGLLAGMWTNGDAILGSKQLAFANVQLELGSVATTFEQRPEGLELALCQRYYEKSYAAASNPGTAEYHGAQYAQRSEADGTEPFGTRFTTRKRAAPTIVIYSPSTGDSGKVRSSGSGGSAAADLTATLGTSSDTAFSFSATVVVDCSHSWHYTASAEL